MATVPEHTGQRWAGAIAGAVAAAVALSMSVLADGFGRGVPSLVLAVDQAVIRLAPGAWARRGIETFGQNDKPGLVLGTVVLALAIGARLGMASQRRPRVATIGFGAFGLLGVVAAVTFADSSVAGALVAGVLAAGAGVLTLRFLGWASTSADPEPPRVMGQVTRRRFLTAAGLSVGGAAVSAALGRTLVRGQDAEAARAGVVLPTATPPAVLPAGTTLDVAGITPLVTANRDFYRIDEALIVPVVDVDSWRLSISGMVETPFELTFADLLDMPVTERFITLACVSNEVGGGLISNARWLGVPLAALLERAGVDPAADQLVGRSVDGFTAGFPIAAALDGRDAMVAIGMNGEPLPRRHGFPARLVVPGLYGYVSATKWLRAIEITTFDSFDAYWIERGWAREGPVKTHSRIDVPSYGAEVAAGIVAVAGVAWAQQRGISRVEVAVDAGDFQEARLAEPVSSDVWRQWVFEWDAPAGEHLLEVRATDAAGAVQDEQIRPVFPDGATGYHAIRVTVV